MSIAIVQSVVGATPPVVQNIQVSLSTPTVGSTIIVAIRSRHDIASVIDNRSNGYAFDGRGDIQGVHLSTFRAFVTTTGSPFNIVVTQGGVGPMVVVAWEISALLSMDKSSAAAGTSTGATQEEGPGSVHPLPIEEFAVTQITGAGASAIAGPLSQVESGWDIYEHDWEQQPNRDDYADGMTEARVLLFLDQSIPLNPRWTGLNAPALWVANLVTYYEKLTANFSGTPTSGVAPLDVTFTDASTGSPSAWFWDFGDGQVSGAQNPTHTYAQGGTYSVRLRVAKQWVPDATFERLSYVVVSGGGSGGGGLPTTPGIPNNPPLSPMPGYPAPPIPGAPWMAQAMVPKPPEPPAPEAPTVAVGLPPLVPGNAKASDSARQERANRVLASIHDGLEREQQKPRSGENDFYLLGTGFESAAAPTTSDDETIGASVGATWVHTDEEGNETLYICFDATAGAADWRAANTAAGLGIGGITGTF